MRPTSVAVLGAGSWGRHFVRNLAELPEAELRLVCDRAAQTRAELTARYPTVRIVAEAADVWADPAIEAVVIATPAEQHAQHVAAALAAGKHVLVEKPLALRYAEGLRLAEAARANGRVLMVGHLLHYHPGIVQLKALIRDGELGRVRYLYSSRLNLGRVRREENILWSFAPHDISLILALVGDLPFEVTAIGGSYVRPNHADVTVTHLLFDNGVRAHIFVSWLHPYKEQRLVVVGSRRMAVFDDLQPRDKLVLHDQHVDVVDDEPIPHRGAGIPVPCAADEPLRAECAHFLACVRDGTPPVTDVREALRVLRVLQAAQQSLVTSGHPVMMPLDDRDPG